jgi:hypothetical protein
MEAAQVFIEIAFQGCLIDLYALFSPSKMDSSLKFEPSADKILKGADHEAGTVSKLALFCHSFAINL